MITARVSSANKPLRKVNTVSVMGMTPISASRECPGVATNRPAEEGIAHVPNDEPGVGGGDQQRVVEPDAAPGALFRHLLGDGGADDQPQGPGDQGA